MTMTDVHLMTAVPTVILGGTITLAYSWLAFKTPTDDSDVDVAIHLAASIFWCSFAYTLRAIYWSLTGFGTLPVWVEDHYSGLSATLNLIFAYGCYRGHKAVWLLLPVDARGKVHRCLAWTIWLDAPRPVRHVLRELGRGFRHLLGIERRTGAKPDTGERRREEDRTGNAPDTGERRRRTDRKDDPR